MKQEDVRLFNGDEILKWLQEYTYNDDDNVYEHENQLKYSNWWKDNVSLIKNIRISNISGVLTDDGTGKFQCELTADIVASKNNKCSIIIT